MKDPVTILNGDVFEELAWLPEKSVHCVVTSPPYWGLRKYLPAGHPQEGLELGSERTPELYVQKMVEVFRAVRRVLRDDGTLWLNLGDSYSQGGNGGHQTSESFHGHNKREGDKTRVPKKVTPGFKPKDLVGIPWRVALALQADGWYLRCDIIWAKPNPMPESVTDRPTKSHEYIFLLSKQPNYFYDAEAVKERPSNETHPKKANGRNSRMVLERAAGKENSKPNPSRGHIPPKTVEEMGGIKNNRSFIEATMETVTSRNKRSVWTIGTAPFPGAHFATFPPELARTCILAGTSARGACPQCGAPWTRVLEGGLTSHDGKTDSAYAQGSTANRLALLRQAARERGEEYSSEKKTVGWEPGCECAGSDSGGSPSPAPAASASPDGRGVVPCVVLDPFGGSGTVGAVCLQEGRRAILIDLNPAYCDLARKRTAVNLGFGLGDPVTGRKRNPPSPRLRRDAGQRPAELPGMGETQAEKLGLTKTDLRANSQ